MMVLVLPADRNPQFDRTPFGEPGLWSQQGRSAEVQRSPGRWPRPGSGSSGWPSTQVNVMPSRPAGSRHRPHPGAGPPTTVPTHCRSVLRRTAGRPLPDEEQGSGGLSAGTARLLSGLVPAIRALFVSRRRRVIPVDGRLCEAVDPGENRFLPRLEPVHSIPGLTSGGSLGRTARFSRIS